jgi:23S rRNA U2552 (ribose-2'-O)-methylase RlmE/FtsJ
MGMNLDWYRNEKIDNSIVPKNDLEKYLIENKGKKLHKWFHYLEIYDRHFSMFRNRPIKMLEIGVFGGGSMQMWKSYFGSDIKIYGIDINPECKNHEDDNIEIFIGSQADRNFLKDVMDKIGNVDILIDDGSHMVDHQIVTFEELYKYVNPGGIYLCEDLHTSYWPHYGGELNSPNSFIEYSKRIIDKLTSWHYENPPYNELTRSVHSMHYYDSMLVIEKREMKEPMDCITGGDQ